MAVVESKVTAASIAALLSSETLGQLAVMLGAPVPGWAVQLVTGLVTAAVTFVAGWLTKHTPRGVETQPNPAPFVQPALSLNVHQAAAIVDAWRAAHPGQQP